MSLLLVSKKYGHNYCQKNNKFYCEKNRQWARRPDFCKIMLPNHSDIFRAYCNKPILMKTF